MSLLDPDSRMPPDATGEAAPLSFTGLSEFMERPASAGGAASGFGRELEPGDRLGDVTITRMIGEGGMGRVYEGLQGSPCRTVAVKVIRPGVLSDSAARRFELEVHILGRLTHPGIARIYSVGLERPSGAPVPYFVMEYVEDAASITAFAERRGLATVERVRLFREACRAVAHGHHKGIIHRDLKPGNILIDASGAPKIIDFGLARSTDGDVARVTRTADGQQLVGTLQYMSPEQFAGPADDLDVRADVYALGVVLYELLAGRPPHDLAGRTVYEAARVVGDVEPPALATVDRRLRGDLETIVATCLDKDRTRRYSSAAELAADLGRYLDGEPIAASRPGLVDSVLRLARRHRLAAALTVASVATLIVGAVGVSVFAVKAERQRLLALEQRRRADAASTEAMQQLYVANLRALQSCLETRNLHLARRLHAENRGLTDAEPPLEMRVMGAGLDDALVVLDPRKGPISRLAYSPDGSLLAMTTVRGPWPSSTPLMRFDKGSRWKVLEGRAACFEVGSRHEYRPLAGHEGSWFTSWLAAADPAAGAAEDADSPLAVSQDGARQALPVSGGGLRVVDRRSGTEATLLRGHRGRLNRVTFSPDGDRLAIHDHSGGVSLWNGSSGDLVARCGARAIAFAFSPEGRRIAVESLAVEPQKNRRAVTVYDSVDGRERSTVLQPPRRGGEPALFALGPGGDLLITSAESDELNLWDVETGASLVRMQGHASGVTAVAFSPDGGQIASGARNGHVRLWNASTGGLEAELLGHDGAVLSLAFRPDGETLASGAEDGMVRIWSRTSDQPLAALRGLLGMTAVAYDPEGRLLAVAQPDAGTVELWNPRSAERHATLVGAEGVVMQIAFAPDGDLVAAACKAPDRSGAVHVWRASDGERLSTLGPHAAGAMSVAFSPDGSRLLTTAGDATAHLWDPRTGHRLLTAAAPHQGLSDFGAAFGLGGRRVVGAWPYVLDSATGVAAAKLLPQGKVTCVATSPDGRVMATALAIGMINLADCATGKSRGSLYGHTDAVRAMAFSPDSTRLATGSLDGTIRLWHAVGRGVAGGGEIRVFQGHEAGVETVVFSPDARRIVSAAADGTVRIWDADGGRELCVLPGQRKFPRAIALSPDGTCLVTADDAGAVRVWGPSNADIVKARRLPASTP